VIKIWALLRGNAEIIAVAGAQSAFAMTAGGGLDIAVSRHVAIRPAQVEYYMTKFSRWIEQSPEQFPLWRWNCAAPGRKMIRLGTLLG